MDLASTGAPLGWGDIALRLALAMVAGAAVGFDRGGHSRPAGLRTTLLVCLAAAVAMIQMDLLLPMAGKAPDSYVTVDLMRLPLGILSGMGFIGAGAIVRQDDRATGVTTAATLWFVTVIGLCLGGGQILLGLAGLVLALVVLDLFKRVELRLRRDHHARLVVAFETGEPIETELERAVAVAGLVIAGKSLAFDAEEQRWEIRYDLRWRSAGSGEATLPDFVPALARRAGVRSLRWEPYGTP